MEEATAEGPKITKQPCFGAQYMLFRVCARRESRLVVAKTAAAAAHGQCGQMWHFDCQRYYSPLRACSGHTFTTCIPPSCCLAGNQKTLDNICRLGNRLNRPGELLWVPLHLESGRAARWAARERPLALLPLQFRPEYAAPFAGGAQPQESIGRGERLEGCPERASPNPLARVRAMVGPGNLGRQERPYARASRKNRDALATGRYCVQGTSGSSGVRALRCAAIWSPPFPTLRRRIPSPWRRGSGSAGRDPGAPLPTVLRSGAASGPGQSHCARARCGPSTASGSPCSLVAGVFDGPGRGLRKPFRSARCAPCACPPRCARRARTLRVVPG